MSFENSEQSNPNLTKAICFGMGLACGWILKGNSSKIFPIRRLFSLKGSIGPGLRMCRTKMVIVVRSDLGMGNGKVASQCAHAALACFEIARGTDVADQWAGQGQPKVVLKLDKGEFGLLELQRNAHSLGIPCTVVRDAGRTQVEAGSATVLGLGPAESEKVDSITGHLKLL